MRRRVYAAKHESHHTPPSQGIHPEDFRITDTEMARQFDPVALAESKELHKNEDFQGQASDERRVENVESQQGTVEQLPVDLFMSSMNMLKLGTDSLGDQIERLALLLSGQLDDLYKARTWEESWFPMSAAVEYTVDYLQRKYLYVYTPVTLSLAVNDGSTLVLTQGWNSLIYRRGTKITAPGVAAGSPVFLLIRATDEQLTTAVTASVGNPVNTTTQVATSVLSSVAGNVAAVQLLPANAARKGATFFNESTATLFLGLVAVASLSLTNYTVQIAPGGFYELAPVYTGVISGIWSAAAGNVRITELS